MKIEFAPTLEETEQGFMMRADRRKSIPTPEIGRIDVAYIGQNTECAEWAPQTSGLNMRVHRTSRLGTYSGFPITDKRLIIKFLNRMGVNSHNELIGMEVGLFYDHGELVGISEPKEGSK